LFFKFKEVTLIFGQRHDKAKVIYVLIWTKNGLGYKHIWEGRFFTKSSGHPDIGACR
jgi:hypothetical protein